MGKRQRWKRVLRWGGALLVVAGLIAAFVLWRGRDRGPAYTWETVEAARGDIEVTIDATGSLEPEHSVTVGAEVSGKIASVEVDEDDRVELGDVLARFDLVTFEGEMAEAKASLASAKADVARARASLHEAELELKRTRKLAKTGVVADEEIEQRETASELAVADLARARAQQQLAMARIDQIDTKIGKAEVHAPIAGVVLSRSIEPGSAVVASFQTPELFTIAADLSRMTLELAIDEADVGRIAVGQQARFRVDAWPEREFAAELTKLHLSPQISGNVVTYVAELAVDNREGLLRPGMTATATISIGTEHDVLRIPTLALRFTPPSTDAESFHFGPPASEQKHASGSAVWVLRDDQPVRVAITAGSSDGQWLAVVGGELEVGDEVLIGAEANQER
ncbi:efflux RND transporter periplasmic adaptor subunit [Nannocystaceae bacterium ST9]